MKGVDKRYAGRPASLVLSVTSPQRRDMACVACQLVVGSRCFRLTASRVM
jgi:hypothetical protein